MPKIGEIRKGSEIGLERLDKHIWLACPNCGKERWARLQGGGVMSGVCKSCHMTKLNKQLCGKKNPRWNGGRQTIIGGYYEVYISAEDPMFLMAGHAKTKSGGFVREHRLVMARHLNRCLERGEIIHHLNGVRTDNRLENLTLANRGNHQHDTVVKCLQERIRTLENKLKETNGVDIVRYQKRR